MKKLRIAQVAPLWFPIPPKKYGGTEKIVYFLTEGLVQRGHEITLFASGNSKTKAKLISVVKNSLTEKKISWTEYVWNGFNLARAIELSNNFDIIHTHWVWLPFLFSKFTKAPLVHTFHNLPQKKDTRWSILNYYRKEVNAVFISKSEKKNCRVKFRKNVVIYNGIDLSHFKFSEKCEDYFAWVGKMEPKKGAEIAVKVARKTGMKLFLAGAILDPLQKKYFEMRVKPYLSRRIKYLGELTEKELSDFYGKAKALLYPLQWDEPFGLVMVEAMACGTPVITFDRGSTKEIVKDKETGFVVKNLKEFIEAIKKIEKISRLNCRKRVEKYFSTEKMVEKYEKFYYQVLKNEKA